MMEEYERRQHENEEKHREIINELIKRQEMMEIKIQEQDDEIRKVKRKSLPNQQGGWGTFSIVFEDNPLKHKAIALNMASSSSQTATPGKKMTSGSVSIAETNDHGNDHNSLQH